MTPTRKTLLTSAALLLVGSFAALGDPLKSVGAGEGEVDIVLGLDTLSAASPTRTTTG